MRALGLDLGTKTLGLAITDRTGAIANPYKTLKFSKVEDVIEPLKKIINEENIGEIALGLPKNMDNSLGFASQRSLDFKSLLEKNIDIPITLVDERLSTVEAEMYLINADMSRKKRKDVIDAVAASVILNTYIRTKGNKNNE
jgi:putative Holliday junction resolvase